MLENYFETRFKFQKGRQKVWKALIEFFQKYIPEGSVLLELGPGYCDFINGIKAKQKIAVDIDSEARKYCNPEIQFINSNLLELKLAPQSIDVVFASNVLEHLNDEELDRLFSAIEIFLKKEGSIILMQPNYYYAFREYWDDFTHKKAFSHLSLTDFLKSKNFEILKIYKRFLPYSFYSIFPKSYYLTKLYLTFPIKFFAKQMLVIARKK